MELNFGSWLKHKWNAFTNNDSYTYQYLGNSSYYRPDRPRLTRRNERSIITSVFNRIALDVAAINIKHVRLDENERYVETVESGLNYCLNLEANIDQTGRGFIQDAVDGFLIQYCLNFLFILYTSFCFLALRGKVRYNCAKTNTKERRYGRWEKI